ncbi:MAG: L-serine ammonia-lyase [Alphaproteobacteria bacterium]
MYHSFFDVFSIGIGPSSSHTMGPMRAAGRFVAALKQQGFLKRVARIRVSLYGSLALTGEGHGTPRAVMYGLMGLNADEMDAARDYIAPIRETGQIMIGGTHQIAFVPEEDIVLEKETCLPEHSNGMTFTAFDKSQNRVLQETYFSIGGGTVVRADEMDRCPMKQRQEVPYPFNTCAELIEQCEKNKLSIAETVFKNEEALRSFGAVKDRITLIDKLMQAAVDRGIATSGILPGGLNIHRRAPMIYKRLEEKFHANDEDPLMIIDWINLWAFAVAEENAAGRQVITAPTMGSAGIIPAVMRYYERFAAKKSPFDAPIGKGIFLLTASAICSLYRTNASISGAEVGCQGEVGVACSMAAAGLAAAMGGTVKQIENAAEIAMEHNLGLTCDPVCGLVQVPCIERNAMAAVKAVNAARLAIRGNGTHLVSLDSVIKTMYETGKNLPDSYKETSLAGLAVHALTC